MKTRSLGTYFLLLVWLLLISAQDTTGQKIIFLHHSTGEGVYSGGGVVQWFKTYNTQHGTSYSITERSYPNTPYPWDNYPYDYWNLWVNGACDNANASVECMDKLTQKYDVIIFKHCFPGADVKADLGSEAVYSSRKSIGNYKLQYRALRALMDSYPKTKFIVWTLAPLHRNATSPANALRARQFVDWVKNDWLKEDHQTHENIFVFDFFGLTAETQESPTNGLTNCLKYDYEGDHNGSDSHPNSLANRTVGSLFAQSIVDAINHSQTSIDQSELTDPGICIYPNPAQNKVTIELGDLFQTGALTLKITNNNSQTIHQTIINGPSTIIELNKNLCRGIYFVQVFNRNNGLIGTKKMMVQ